MNSKMKWLMGTAVGILLVVFVLARRTQTPVVATETSSAQADAVTATTSTTTTTLPTSARAQSSVSPAARSVQPREQDLKSFLKAADPQADWVVNRSSDGQITAISGGLIAQDISNSDQALALAQKLAGYLGIDPNQIRQVASSLPPTADTRSVRFSQVIDGYQVWGSEMNLFARNKDNKIYYVTNEVRPLKTVETRIDQDLAAAQRAIPGVFAGKKVEIESAPEKPVIIAKETGDGELAWQFQIRVTHPRFERRLLFLSTRDLSVLKNVDLVLKN